MLISPTIHYLAWLLLFPRDGSVDETVDYKTHFYANYRAFFTVFGLFWPIDIIDTLLKGIPHFLNLGWPYVLNAAVSFVGLVIAAATRNERYRQIFAVFFLVETDASAFAIFYTLT